MDKPLKLKRQARQSATWRGHRLGFFKSLGRNRYEAHCRDCGMEAYVVLRPTFNEIDISGEAVALNCRENTNREQLALPL